ncbi:type II toxin-antitoxin system Phd/YefM family antitoxin [Thermodesulfobacteriota bacterium]
METLSLSEAKIKLSNLVDRVNNLDDEIIITKNGRPAAVLVSPEEYEGWKETILIHTDPDFVEDIKKGLKALKNKRAKLYTLEELFDE